MAKSDPDVCTPLELVFCRHFIVTNDGTKAAQLTNPKYSKKVAGVRAAQWMRRKRVKKEVARLRKELDKHALMGAEEVERHLDTLIRFNLRDYVNADGTPKDLHKLTKEQAACVKELGIIETSIGTSRNLKFFDKVQAIRTKMQRLGMLKDVHEHVTETYAERIKRLRGQHKP